MLVKRLIANDDSWAKWVKPGSHVYVCESSYTEKDLPKDAKFWWHREKKAWWTDDMLKASRLAEFADISCEEELKKLKKSSIVNSELSTAASIDADYARPDGLDYRPFQKVGIKFAVNVSESGRGVLIGDDMGLGKTIQAIGFVNTFDAACINRVLVISPNSLKINWYREWSKWCIRKDLTVAIADSKIVPLPEDGFNVTIINWDIIARKLELLKRQNWDVIIADECHMAKNPASARGQALYSIPSKFKIALTGTPILNRPKEIFAMIKWLDPERWGDKEYFFVKRYCGGFRNPKGANKDNLPELNRVLRETVMIRRLKSEVLKELPPKVRQIIEVTVDSKTAELVARERQMYDKEKPNLERLQAVLQMSKASDNEADYNNAVRNLKEAMGAAFAEQAALRHEVALAKVPYTIKHVEDIIESGQKVVLFGWHKDALQGVLDHFGNTAVRITGDDSPEVRQSACDRFMNDPKCTLIGGTIGAMGVGWTLVSSSFVVMMELDWVPGNVSQAEDRCHRIGQLDSVLVHHIVLEGSIDAKMANTLIEKQEIIDLALGKDPESIQDSDEPVLPEPKDDRPATVTDSRKKIAELAEKLTPSRILAIHDALRVISGMCDGANRTDGMGFNKIDSFIGKSLAENFSLTPKQAALGYRIARKYKKQLSEEMVLQMSGKDES